MNQTKQNEFLVTRPRLASFLIDTGIECQTTTNPYNQNLKAWSVSLTKESAKLIEAYYLSIDRPIPSKVNQVLKEGAING